jgi:hypothetical protein
MARPRQRAYIGPEEERRIREYIWSPRYHNVKRVELAKELRKQINWPKGMPKLEVLEKKITKCRKEKTSRDEPWNMYVPSECSNHPESLPIVLQIQAWVRDKFNTDLTIREAEWITRLHYVVIAIANNLQIEKIPIHFVWNLVSMYATGERIWEKTEISSGEKALNTIIREFMTTAKSLPELIREFQREFPPGSENGGWRVTETGAVCLKVTKEKLALAKEMWRILGYSKPFEDMSDLGITLEIKEAKNDD